MVHNKTNVIILLIALTTSPFGYAMESAAPISAPDTVYQTILNRMNEPNVDRYWKENNTPSASWNKAITNTVLKLIQTSENKKTLAELKTDITQEKLDNILKPILTAIYKAIREKAQTKGSAGFAKKSIPLTDQLIEATIKNIEIYIKKTLDLSTPPEIIAPTITPDIPQPLSFELFFNTLTKEKQNIYNEIIKIMETHNKLWQQGLAPSPEWNTAVASAIIKLMNTSNMTLNNILSFVNNAIEEKAHTKGYQSTGVLTKKTAPLNAEIIAETQQALIKELQEKNLEQSIIALLNEATEQKLTDDNLLNYVLTNTLQLIDLTATPENEARRQTLAIQALKKIPETEKKFSNEKIDEIAKKMWAPAPVTPTVIITKEEEKEELLPVKTMEPNPSLDINQEITSYLDSIDKFWEENKAPGNKWNRLVTNKVLNLMTAQTGKTIEELEKSEKKELLSSLLTDINKVIQEKAQTKGSEGTGWGWGQASVPLTKELIATAQENIKNSLEIALGLSTQQTPPYQESFNLLTPQERIIYGEIITIMGKYNQFWPQGVVPLPKWNNNVAEDIMQLTKDSGMTFKRILLLANNAIVEKALTKSSRQKSLLKTEPAPLNTEIVTKAQQALTKELKEKNIEQSIITFFNEATNKKLKEDFLLIDVLINILAIMDLTGIADEQTQQQILVTQTLKKILAKTAIVSDEKIDKIAKQIWYIRLGLQKSMGEGWESKPLPTEKWYQKVAEKILLTKKTIATIQSNISSNDLQKIANTIIYQKGLAKDISVNDIQIIQNHLQTQIASVLKEITPTAEQSAPAKQEYILPITQIQEMETPTVIPTTQTGTKQQVPSEPKPSGISEQTKQKSGTRQGAAQRKLPGQKRREPATTGVNKKRKNGVTRKRKNQKRTLSTNRQKAFAEKRKKAQQRRLTRKPIESTQR